MIFFRNTKNDCFESTKNYYNIVERGENCKKKKNFDRVN